MQSRKKEQNVSKLLVFVEIEFLWSPGTKMLSAFNRWATFYKRFETPFLDKCFWKCKQTMPKNRAWEEK